MAKNKNVMGFAVIGVNGGISFQYGKAENILPNIRKIVCGEDGLLERLQVRGDVELWGDEEGLCKELKPNVYFPQFVGNLFFVGPVKDIQDLQKGFPAPNDAVMDAVFNSPYVSGYYDMR